DDDTKRVVAAALDCVGAVPTPTRARLLAALAGAHDAGLDWKRRHDLALQAVDAARRADDATTFVDVISTTYTDVATPDRQFQASVDDLERAVGLADRLGDPLRRILPRWHL